MSVGFDSSALLAVVFEEDGAEVAARRPSGGIVSAVNTSEGRCRRSPRTWETYAATTSNAVRLRASLLNSTATRWMGSPVPRYLSA